ncbi:MAG: hypothetical protein ACR2QO_11665 [Acidimicrobiales bacterium]
MRVALVGLGTTGSHVARQLMRAPCTEIAVADVDVRRLDRVLPALRSVAGDISIRRDEPDPADPADVVMLAGPVGTHTKAAASMLAAGSHVVSLSDDPDECKQLLALDETARGLGRSVVVGAGFVPGLSCVLARFAADQLDVVEMISVYKAGTGGPACARQHHRALQSDGEDWVDGEWTLRRGGSGRDLAWFPEPLGARDCYRGALPSPLLLQREFPDASRISARVSATRRDRLTSRLPMLRPPHNDGGPGALRVEVRGRAHGAVETLVMGAIDHPSVAAATVAAVVASEAGYGRAPIGAGGLASWSDPKRLLGELRRRGVRVASFSGVLDTLLA